MFLSLQALSVLARIGWEEDLRKEAETVAKFVSLPFPQLQRETKKLRDRGVVVPRGRYLYVSPDLLAVNAAADLWDTMGPEVIRLVEEFPVQEPRKQLLRRVAMMGEHPEVKKAVEKILSRNGLFIDLPKLNDPLLSEIFRILSSAAPEAATNPSSKVEAALEIIEGYLRNKSASVEQFGESAWKVIETLPAGRVSHTFDWHWGRVAAPLAVANPARFARAFVGLFESDETWLATDSAQHCLRTAAAADPAGVWDVIGPALMREDQTGMRVRIKLEHWFGELLPPDLLVSWAKRNGRKGFLHAAALLSVRSGTPSEAARLLVREAKDPNEVLLLIFSSIHTGFGAGPLSGLMERNMEPLRNLASDSEPRIRAWARAQMASEQKMVKRQKLIEEERE